MKQTLQIEFEVLTSWTELNEAEQKLVKQAQVAAGRAYAPYSKFQVGAALLNSENLIYEGNNQENIAYPSGLCAERVALFHHGAMFPETAVNTICVVANGDLIAQDMCLSPCGSCRQVMVETEMRQGTPIRVILVAQNGKTWIFNKVSDLLVFPFGVR